MNFKEFLKESNKELDDEYIMQELADKDINAKIDDKYVYVDKDDITLAKKILKNIGCAKAIKELKWISKNI